MTRLVDHNKILKSSERPSQKIRVLISGHLPPPYGGMATFYENLMASSLSTQINLAFVQTSSHTRRFEQSGRLSLNNLVLSLSDCRRFTTALLKHKPQIAHIGTAFGLSFIKHSICVLIARMSGVKVLLHPHCSLSSLYFDKSKIWRWYFRRIVALSHGIIALSKEWFDLQKILPGCKVYALPNAIDLNDFHDIAWERCCSRRLPGPIHLLYLGYIGTAKGSIDLVEATRLAISNGLSWDLRLIGGELSQGECDLVNKKILAENLGGHISIQEGVIGAKKLNAFRWADVFVYPSYKEGMPMAVIEAMASGLPVVASRVGGLPDLILEGITGRLVDPGCPEQIVDAVQRLADKPDLGVLMGQKGYLRVVREFDIESRVTQLVEIYTSMLAKN